VISLAAVTKKFLVVDAWVLGKASTNSVDDSVFKAADVLARILYVCHRVVLDLATPNSETILDEYKRQAKSDLTKRWLIAIQTRPDKVVYRYKANVTLPVLSDPDDLKYLQVALNSPNKLIISEDGDLASIANDPQVVSRGIVIWSLDAALSNL